MAEPSNAPVASRAGTVDAVSSTGDEDAFPRSPFGSVQSRAYGGPMNRSVQDHVYDRPAHGIGGLLGGANGSQRDGGSARHSSNGTGTPPIHKPPTVIAVEEGRFSTGINKLAPFWRKYITTPLYLIISFVGIVLLILFIAFAVLYAKSKKPHTAPILFSSNSTSNLTFVTLPDTSAPLIQDSSLGLAPANFSNYFAPASSVALKESLVYNAGNNTVCLKGHEVGQPWQTNVQCISGLDIMDNSPITMLDWIGGPSLWWISKNSTLTGIDHVPSDNSWKISSVASQHRPTSNTTQLQAVTWLYGTSAWLYYQDVDGQIREFGLDDYRDVEWRDGSIGPLGLAQPASGIAVVRYLIDGNESMELYWETANNAIKGRLYQDRVWTSDTYTVDNSTTYSVVTSASDVDQTSSMSGTIVGTKIMLSYISSDGSVTVQYRETNATAGYNAFSQPQKIFTGDGMVRTGLSSTGANGTPDIVVVKGQSIWQITADDVTSVNWSATQIP